MQVTCGHDNDGTSVIVCGREVCLKCAPALIEAGPIEPLPPTPEHPPVAGGPADWVRWMMSGMGGGA